MIIAVVHIDAGSVGDQIVMAGSILHTAQRDVAPEPDVEGAIGGFVLDVAVACTAGVGVEPDAELRRHHHVLRVVEAGQKLLEPPAAGIVLDLHDAAARSSTRTGLSTMPI